MALMVWRVEVRKGGVMSAAVQGRLGSVGDVSRYAGAEGRGDGLEAVTMCARIGFISSTVRMPWVWKAWRKARWIQV